MAGRWSTGPCLSTPGVGAEPGSTVHRLGSFWPRPEPIRLSYVKRVARVLSVREAPRVNLAGRAIVTSLARPFCLKAGGRHDCCPAPSRDCDPLLAGILRIGFGANCRRFPLSRRPLNRHDRLPARIALAAAQPAVAGGRPFAVRNDLEAHSRPGRLGPPPGGTDCEIKNDAVKPRKRVGAPLTLGERSPPMFGLSLGAKAAITEPRHCYPGRISRRRDARS